MINVVSCVQYSNIEFHSLESRCTNGKIRQLSTTTNANRAALYLMTHPDLEPNITSMRDAATQVCSAPYSSKVAISRMLFSVVFTTNTIKYTQCIAPYPSFLANKTDGMHSRYQLSVTQSQTRYRMSIIDTPSHGD